MTGHIWGKSPAGGAVGKTTRSHPGTTTFPETTLVGCQPPGAVMMAAATAMRTTEAPTVVFGDSLTGTVVLRLFLYKCTVW